MSTSLESYQQRLLLELRLRDMPGPRIAEALAEVDSHVSETGEDVHSAFGPPQAYAARLAAQLGQDRGGGWWGLVRSLTPTHWIIALLAGAGSVLFTDGLFDLVAGAHGWLGLSPVVTTATGLLLLAGLTGWLVTDARGDTDQVRDPRTGADMVPPMPRWVIALLIGSPVCLLAIGLVAAAASR